MQRKPTPFGVRSGAAGAQLKPAQAGVPRTPAAPSPAVQRRPAPHVQAAIAAAAQPRMPAEARLPPRPAAHVQAAVAQAKRAPQSLVSQRPPAPHVQAAVSSAAQAKAPPASQLPAARPAQARPAAPLPARPAPRVEHASVLQRAKRKFEGKERPERRKKRRIDYSEDRIFASLNQEIEEAEKKDIETGEKKLQENLEKYKAQLKKKPKVQRDRRRTFTYGTTTSEQDVTSNPISKDLMLTSYAKAKTNQLGPTFFYVPTTTSEGDTFEQHFVIRQGHDYVLFPLVPNDKDVYRQVGQYGPSFEDLAANAEETALWLTEKFEEDYGSLRAARARVARDINRMAGDRKPKVSYPLKYLAGAAGLTTFAAVIRADKGRESKATKYIESILKESKSSFQIRFGGEKPTYKGTGKGTGRGPEGLRRKAKKDPGEDSEYSDDEKN